MRYDGSMNQLRLVPARQVAYKFAIRPIARIAILFMVAMTLDQVMIFFHATTPGAFAACGLQWAIAFLFLSDLLAIKPDREVNR